MRKIAITLLLFLSSAAAERQVAPANEPLLRPGDRIAWVGGTFVERMQFNGMIEAELQCRRPDWRLVSRNLGWSGDDVTVTARKAFGQPDEGVQRLLADLATADPDVVILGYGFSEPSDEGMRAEDFEAAYRRLISRIAETTSAGEDAASDAPSDDSGAPSEGRSGDPAAAPRIVLLLPLAMPGYRAENYRDAVDRCRGIVERIGRDLSLPVIDAPWSPSDELLEWNQLLPSAAGYRQLADAYADRLVGGAGCEDLSAELLQRIVERDELFFHRHRPQNETYLFLFRKHEQGNNAVEIPQFDPLIDAADEGIWKAAR